MRVTSVTVYGGQNATHNNPVRTVKQNKHVQYMYGRDPSIAIKTGEEEVAKSKSQTFIEVCLVFESNRFYCWLVEFTLNFRGVRD